MFESSRIRAVVSEDLPLLLSWRNHEAVRMFMLTQHEITLEEHRDWFSRANVDPSRRLLIAENDEGPFAYVQFSHVAEGGVADWGFYARPHAPKGMGRVLGRLALDYAFNELKLHKVCGQAIASNAASIAFHERMGFSREGVLRDQHRIEEVYHSLVCFGLLAHEWQRAADLQESTNAED